MGEWEECTMLVNIEPDPETFLPPIILRMPADGDSDCWVTVPLGPAEAARLGSFLVQSAIAVQCLNDEMEPLDLPNRAEVMDLYAMFQAPAAAGPD